MVKSLIFSATNLIFSGSALTYSLKGRYFGHQRPPGGWDEISKYPENGEEIGVFYCLALKNGEEIRRR